MSPERVSVGEERGRSSHVDGLKTETTRRGNQQWRVCCGESGG